MENRHGRFIKLIAVVSVVLFLGSIWSFSSRSDTNLVPDTEPPVPINSKYPLPPLPTPPPPKSDFDLEYHPDPAPFPPPEGAEDVVLVIKTGSQVIWQRLPIHLITTTTRTPNFLVFSDLAERFGNVPVHDCLKNVKPALKEDHKQFEIYRKARVIKPFPGFTNLDAIPSTRPYNLDIAKMKLDGGWDLDKYKNVPILYQAYRAVPGKRWYIFIDADSFVFVGNLVRYLDATYNPSKPLYIGSQTLLGNEIFAHGGTGYILSGAAAKLAVVDHPELEHAFEEYAINHCCGDHVLSRVMDKVGVGLTYERGRLQGEPWYGIRWDDRTWCSEILSFHHVGQGDVQELWEFERLMEQKLAKDKKNGGYILYSDLYHRFARPFLTSLEPAWDNLSNDKWLEVPGYPSGFSKENPPRESDIDKIEDENNRNKWRDYLRFSNTEKAAIDDRDKCAQACKEREKCLQWKWVKGKCVLNDSVIFGFKDPNPKGESEAWWSGWLLDRIDEVRGRMKCERGLEGGFPMEEKRKKEAS
ncbi:hypothetical protein BDZ91DRAFT_788522 [Kalaharituber pfeilii]|nr:hypothetical protein BDZ91DRAFT_788522 [Kalaharituber pfeilii]